MSNILTCSDEAGTRRLGERAWHNRPGEDAGKAGKRNPGLGHVAALRRLRVGPFSEAQAIPLDKIRATDDTPPASPDLLLPVATALADIPAPALTEAEASDLRHDLAISLVTSVGRIPGSADPNGGLVRAMAGGRVIGLARLQDGMAKPERVL